MIFLNGPKDDPFGAIYGPASDINGDGHTDLWEAATYSDILDEMENEESGIDDTDDDFDDDLGDDSCDDFDDDSDDDSGEDFDSDLNNDFDDDLY